jgi:hypothetical protein
MAMFDSANETPYWVNEREADKDNGNYQCDDQARCSRTKLPDEESEGHGHDHCH